MLNLHGAGVSCRLCPCTVVDILTITVDMVNSFGRVISASIRRFGVRSFSSKADRAGGGSHSIHWLPSVRDVSATGQHGHCSTARELFGANEQHQDLIRSQIWVEKRKQTILVAIDTMKSPT
jgi:hypothetical protein